MPAGLVNAFKGNNRFVGIRLRCARHAIGIGGNRVARIVGDNRPVVACCRWRKGVGAVRIDWCIPGVVAVKHYNIRHTGQRIGNPKAQGIIGCGNAVDNRIRLINPDRIHSGGLAVTGAAAGEEVVVLLPFGADGQGAVCKLSAVAPLGGAAARRTLIGVGGPAAAVAGQGEGDVLVAPAAVCVAGPVGVVHVDGRSGDGLSVDVDIKAGGRVAVSAAGGGDGDAGCAGTDRFDNQRVIPAGADSGNACVAAACLNRAAVGVDVDNPLVAAVHNLIADLADNHFVLAAAAVPADNDLKGRALGNLSGAGGGDLDGGGAGVSGADLQLEAVRRHLGHTGVGVGEGDAAGVGVDVDIAHVTLIHIFVRDARQLHRLGGVVAHDDVKRDGAALITGAGGGDLDGRPARLDAGHGDVALGGGVGHFRHAGVAGGHPQRAAVVVDADNLLFADVQILVGDVVQRDLLGLVGRAGAAGVDSLGRGGIAAPGLDIQGLSVVVNPVAVAVQAVDLPVAVQVGGGVVVDVVDDGVVVIHDVAVGAGGQKVERQIPHRQGGALRGVDGDVGEAPAVREQSALLQDGLALDADVGKLGVAGSKDAGGVLALYLQLGGVDVIELDPVAAAVDIEGALDVHILQGDGAGRNLDVQAADKGLVGDGHRAGVDVAVLVDLGLAVGALLRKTRAGVAGVLLRGGRAAGGLCQLLCGAFLDRLAADRLINRRRVLGALLARGGAGGLRCARSLGGVRAARAAVCLVGVCRGGCLLRGGDHNRLGGGRRTGGSAGGPGGGRVRLGTGGRGVRLLHHIFFLVALDGRVLVRRHLRVVHNVLSRVLGVRFGRFQHHLLGGLILAGAEPAASGERRGRNQDRHRQCNGFGKQVVLLFHGLRSFLLEARAYLKTVSHKFLLLFIRRQTGPICYTLLKKFADKLCFEGSFAAAAAPKSSLYHTGVIFQPD